METLRFVENKEQLFAVLDLCYGILGEELREREPYRREDWLARLASDARLLRYAQVDGRIVSAVLGRRENAESLVVGFVACVREFRRRGITKRLMESLEEEALRQGFRYITLGSDADGFYEKCGYQILREIHGQKIFQNQLEVHDEGERPVSGSGAAGRTETT